MYISFVCESTLKCNIVNLSLPGQCLFVCLCISSFVIGCFVSLNAQYGCDIHLCACCLCSLYFLRSFFLCKGTSVMCVFGMFVRVTSSHTPHVGCVCVALFLYSVWQFILPVLLMVQRRFQCCWQFLCQSFHMQPPPLLTLPLILHHRWKSSSHPTDAFRF